MMQLRALIPAVALAAALVSPACAAPDSLDGTDWLLLELHGAATADAMAASAAVGGTTPTISFERGRVVGSDGCNQFFTSGTAAGGVVNMQPGGMGGTLRACEQPVMQLGLAYRAAVSSATAYRLSADRLTLLGANGNALADFSALKTDLAGTSWEVTGYNDGKQAVVSVTIGSKLTAEFGPEGKLGGSAGCNRYNASYEAKQGAVHIGPAMSTRRMCVKPDGVMEQEALFLRALATAATYRFNGDRMELRNADGALAVTLRRVAPGQ